MRGNYVRNKFSFTADLKLLPRKYSYLDPLTLKVPLKDVVCYLSLLEAGRPEDKLECKYIFISTLDNFTTRRSIANIFFFRSRRQTRISFYYLTAKTCVIQLKKKIVFHEFAFITIYVKPTTLRVTPNLFSLVNKKKHELLRAT